ncbi:hypothetical protein [Chryseobacterium sp. MA9]|uniref:hypothetical protein n=1 Tax=Chryseobacterium sp. MA9 TaxID=2966625 RepID=UPI0021035794|nr:hypothetical protein [Chryseobacterium sp. MA9]UTX48920.1 hypothetical protein KIK00_01225 [Chryseobacterium sp. MA9]
MSQISNNSSDENCEKFLQNENVKLQKFKENESKYKIDFLKLRNEVFSKKNLNKIKTKNIGLYILSNTFVNDHITNCESRSTLHYNKMLFLDQIFWCEENLKYISVKSKKNIFPAINYGTKFITNELLDYLKDDLISYNYLKNLPTIDNYKYIQSSKDLIQHLGLNYTKVLVNFTQYESKKMVSVQITDLKERNQKNLIYKFDGKWILISESTNRI